MGMTWQEDTWCCYLPDLHRVLADESMWDRMPMSFVSLDPEQTCAWWESLRYLLRNLLGWRCIPAGLAWWYDAGKSDSDDRNLRLVLDRWNTRGELDYFAAREWKTQGLTGMGGNEELWEVADYEPEPGWWRQLERPPPNVNEQALPYFGGWNPLHLGHSDFVGLDRVSKPPVVNYNQSKRRAVVVVNGFDSWQHDLMEAGKLLPELGDRSWRVEVFDRKVGFLGLFRQSRVTGLWFQGKHSIHMAGNPQSEPKVS